MKTKVEVSWEKFDNIGNWNTVASVILAVLTFNPDVLYSGDKHFIFAFDSEDMSMVYRYFNEAVGIPGYKYMTLDNDTRGDK